MGSFSLREPARRWLSWALVRIFRFGQRNIAAKPRFPEIRKNANPFSTHKVDSFAHF
jgi:hypothetical protein